MRDCAASYAMASNCCGGVFGLSLKGRLECLGSQRIVNAALIVEGRIAHHHRVFQIAEHQVIVNGKGEMVQACVKRELLLDATEGRCWRSCN